MSLNCCTCVMELPDLCAQNIRLGKKMEKVKRWAGISLLLLMMTTEIWAVNINVKGNIKDKKSKEPLIGATIQIVGSATGAITDLNGNFELKDVKDGIYDIEIKYVGYKTAVRKKVQVVNSKVVVLNLEMDTDEQPLGDVVVVGKASRESENAVLLEQKRSVLAVQSVGAKELSRKGVSDAQGAVTKVSGISKQEGVKNVFVRGLGDRYNITTLNGFPIPSEDPEYKNISLDFFGTDVIQAVGVNKAFSAGNSADVGGANIDVLSKELTGDSELNIGISGGLNTKTVNADFLKMDGVNAFGFARDTKPSDDLTSYSFKNRLDPSESHLQLNQSYGVSAGKKLEVAGNPLSFYLVASHSKKYAYYEEEVRNTTTTGTLTQDETGKKSTIETSQMALANLDYALAGKHRLAYNLMMVHAGIQSVGDYWGMDSEYQSSDDYEGFMRRQQTNDNLLFVHQLSTDWVLSKGLKFNAGASFNTIKGLEPDRRINNLVKEAKGYVPMKGTGIQQRYFSTLREKDWNVRSAFQYQLPDNFEQISTIQIGYWGRFVDDDFDATEYDMSVSRQPVFDRNNLSFDDYYNQQNLDDKYFKMDKNIDEYTVSKNIHTAYAEAIYQLTSKFIANVGVKYDDVNLTVDYNVNRGGTQGSRKIDKSYFLPSLNLRYNLTDEQSIRLSGSKTYTLPQAKEISPFRYTGVSFNSQGNQNLQPSDNYNVDLKWDYYLSPGEILSVTGFYKYIQNPISRIEIASAGGYLSYENIADHAMVAGVEMEVRKNLFSRPLAGDGWNKLTFGLNGSYIYTYAKVPLATDKNGSQLEGAAPWIVNADLSHQLTTGNKTFVNTLVFNYFSDRVYTIGTEGYQDIMENGLPTLDFISSAKLNKNITLSLKARNLLNATHQLTRQANVGGEEIVLNRYKKGIDFSLGVSCNF